MKIGEIAALIGADTIHTDWDDRTFTGAFTSDLLSDAMANAPEEGILITIQAHKNTVAVGTLKELAAIVVCSDRPIPDDMIAAARAERIAIFVTAESQFTVSGILYAAGVR